MTCRLIFLSAPFPVIRYLNDTSRAEVCVLIIERNSQSCSGRVCETVCYTVRHDQPSIFGKGALHVKWGCLFFGAQKLFLSECESHDPSEVWALLSNGNVTAGLITSFHYGTCQASVYPTWANRPVAITWLQSRSNFEETNQARHIGETAN